MTRVRFGVWRVVVWVLTVFVLAASTPSSATDAAVERLEKGDRPRVRLVVTPRVGDTQVVEMTMRTAMQMAMGGQEMPRNALPGMVLTMRSVVDEVQGDGTITYSFEVVAVRVESDSHPAEVVDAMTAELEKSVGLKGTSQVTATGRPIDTTFDLPPNADESMKQTYAQLESSMGQMAAPLPAKKIGVGGKWQVVQMIDNRGMVLEQTITYTVVSLEGRNLGLDLSIAQTADPQVVDTPGMPEGANANLRSLDSTGTGSMTMDLDRILPQRSSLELASNIEMSMEAMGQSADVSMTMDVAVSLETK